MTIMKNALRGRIRKKELYIVVAIAALILLFCSSDASSITVNGEPVTDFGNMLPVLHNIVNLAACLLAMILSLGTIPEEYRQKTSHLVWIRGVSQTNYHVQLMLANLFSAAFAGAILYLVIAAYAVMKGRAVDIPGLLPAFLVIMVNVTLISLLVSVLSIKLPSLLVGLIGIICILGGALHGILETVGSMLGGLSGTALKGALMVIPDLSGIQAQASNLILHKPLDVHIILVGLLSAYVVSAGVFVLRRKEA